MPVAGDGGAAGAVARLDAATAWCVGVIALALAAWLAAIVLMTGYPITAERQQSIRHEIENRRNVLPEGANQ